MLFLPPGTARVQRLHGAFVSDQEVHRVVDFIKQQGSRTTRWTLLEGERRGGGRGRRRRGLLRRAVRPGRAPGHRAPPGVDLVAAAPAARRLQPRRAHDRAHGARGRRSPRRRARRAARSLRAASTAEALAVALHAHVLDGVRGAPGGGDEPRHVRADPAADPGRSAGQRAHHRPGAGRGHGGQRGDAAAGRHAPRPRRAPARAARRRVRSTSLSWLPFLALRTAGPWLYVWATVHAVVWGALFASYFTYAADLTPPGGAPRASRCSASSA